jgi:hypothetical protein
MLSHRQENHEAPIWATSFETLARASSSGSGHKVTFEAARIERDGIHDPSTPRSFHKAKSAGAVVSRANEQRRFSFQTGSQIPFKTL